MPKVDNGNEELSVTEGWGLSQQISICHRQSVSVRYSMCLCNMVSKCHRQSVSVRYSLCLCIR